MKVKIWSHWCHFNDLEKTSKQSPKRKGESRSPYRRPLSPLKYPYMPPLINIEYETVVMHSKIHVTYYCGNLNPWRTVIMKPQSTLSKALWRSTLRTHLGKSSSLHISLITLELSVYFQRESNLWWMPPMLVWMLSITSTIFVARIFKIILYTIVQHEISL